MLSDLLGENDIGHPVIYSEHLTGDGDVRARHVEYRDITSEGLLRQSSFKGLKRN
jgi:hypothetical protein